MHFAYGFERKVLLLIPSQQTLVIFRSTFTVFWLRVTLCFFFACVFSNFLRWFFTLPVPICDLFADYGGAFLVLK